MFGAPRIAESDREDASREAHAVCAVCGETNGCIESRCPSYGCCGSTVALIVVKGEPVCAIGCADIMAQPSVSELATRLAAGGKSCR